MFDLPYIIPSNVLNWQKTHWMKPVERTWSAHHQGCDMCRDPIRPLLYRIVLVARTQHKHARVKAHAVALSWMTFHQGQSTKEIPYVHTHICGLSWRVKKGMKKKRSIAILCVSHVNGMCVYMFDLGCDWFCPLADVTCRLVRCVCVNWCLVGSTIQITLSSVLYYILSMILLFTIFDMPSTDEKKPTYINYIWCFLSPQRVVLSI